MARRMKPVKTRKPSKEEVKAKADRAAAKAESLEAGNPVMGRPSKFTLSLGCRICEMIADAIPLARICNSEDMPDQSTVYRWLREHEDFRHEYVRAREARADARMDRIDEITNKVEAGELKPDVARVMIDAIKWQMGKEKPKAYGDKVALTDPDGGKLVIEFKA
jgi:hypothetical protein